MVEFSMNTNWPVVQVAVHNLSGVRLIFPSSRRNSVQREVTVVGKRFNVELTAQISVDKQSNEIKTKRCLWL
jgi:hypothetical protein